MTAVSTKVITRWVRADDSSVGTLAAPRAPDRSRISRLRRHGQLDLQDIHSLMAGAICRNAAQGRRSLPETTDSISP
jgi:hypothetical protein